MKTIPYNKQYIDKIDILEVKKSLTSDVIAAGPMVDKFEKNLSKSVNCKYTVVCNSGTSALHLAFLSIDLKKNDVVIMPIVNFIAAYNMCKNLGAKVFFADVNKHTGQMEEKDVLNCINQNKLKKIKLILIMHLAGHVSQPEKFYKLKKKLNCYLIEDACHALGSSYKIKEKQIKTGSCKHSDIAVFSFHALKTITTGEGGAICTNSKKIFVKSKLYRSHGMIKKSFTKYDIMLNGFNFRLSDINASLGISQLKKLKKLVNNRRKIAANYYSLMNNLVSSNYLSLPNINFLHLSAWHLFVINLNFKKIKKKKKNFITFMRKKNILVQNHYIPINKFSTEKKFYLFKNAENYYKYSVSIPLYVNLNLKKQKYIVNNIERFVKKND